MSNQWLFVAPQNETFTALCPDETTTVRLQKEGKLTLKLRCKGYSFHVTLYATSIIITHLSEDYVPSSLVDFDCCFEDIGKIKFEELPLQIPLVNVMFEMDELRITSVKVEEVNKMIKDQDTKYNQKLYMIATSWGNNTWNNLCNLLCISCSCCCYKCCRNSFWLWDK
jgi:hypothetical protein